MNTKQRGFTMVELLTVIGIVAILAVVVVLAINPQQLLMQSRDSNRVGSLTTIVTSVALAKSEGLSLGTPNIAYISIPDPTLTGNQTSTCASLGLPVLASTTYQCVSPANVAKDNGTGWIPIAFTSLPGGFPLGSLPVDPVNSTSSHEYYIYTTNGSGYEVMANPEAAKNASNTSSFVQGTNLALVTSFPTGSSGGGGTKTCNSSTWNCAANNVCADTLGDGSHIVVANTDLAGTYAWEPAATACTQPQCQSYSTTTNGGNGDGEYLVADNTVDFSNYPARAACQALGGRLPTVTELTCIYNNQSSFGGNFTNSAYYWSSAEYNAGFADIVIFRLGFNGASNETLSDKVRCVLGW